MILPYSKINKTGEKIEYFTHSSYLAENELAKLRKADDTRKTYRNYLALFGLIAGFKVFVTSIVGCHHPSRC